MAEDNGHPKDDAAEALMREALESMERREQGATEGVDVDVDLAEDESGADEAEGSGPGAAAAGNAAVEGEAARLRETLEKVEAARKENYDKFMRALADLENLRKRAQKEKADLQKYGHEQLAFELLGVVDNFERAIGSANLPDEASEAFRQFIEGVKMIHTHLMQTLARFEVKPFESLGRPFDPNLHQAMSRVPSDEVPVNHVVAELQKGYRVHDRLLRPAMVAVSTGPAQAENASEAGASEEESTPETDGDWGA